MLLQNVYELEPRSLQYLTYLQTIVLYDQRKFEWKYFAIYCTKNTAVLEVYKKQSLDALNKLYIHYDYVFDAFCLYAFHM